MPVISCSERCVVLGVFTSLSFKKNDCGTPRELGCSYLLVLALQMPAFTGTETPHPGSPCGCQRPPDASHDQCLPGVPSRSWLCGPGARGGRGPGGLSRNQLVGAGFVCSVRNEPSPSVQMLRQEEAMHVSVSHCPPIISLWDTYLYMCIYQHISFPLLCLWNFCLLL